MKSLHIPLVIFPACVKPQSLYFWFSLPKEKKRKKKELMTSYNFPLKPKEKGYNKLKNTFEASGFFFLPEVCVLYYCSWFESVWRSNRTLLICWYKCSGEKFNIARHYQYQPNCSTAVLRSLQAHETCNTPWLQKSSTVRHSLTVKASFGRFHITSVPHVTRLHKPIKAPLHALTNL